MTNVFLGPNNNIFTATAAGDVIYGEGGNDRLTASAGGNTLNGGEGDDVLLGAAGNDVLRGDDDTDLDARNVLKSFGGDDTITSLSWFDQVDAGSGNDLVGSFAQTTGQVIDGGTGADTIQMNSLTGVNDPVNISFGSTFVAVVGGINGATYMNFETLEVTLGTGANTIQAGGGDDFLLTAYNNGSNNTNEFEAGFVRAGGGDDTVAFNGIARAGSGVQQLVGGSGVDRLSWTNGSSAITDLVINSQDGTMFGLGREFATFSSFETVEFRTYDGHTGIFSYTGFDGADKLTVGFTSGTIDTKGGNDTVDIGAGSSVINGGTGNDFIRISYANSSSNLLRGGNGKDTLIGGSGKDELFGEDGNDSLSAFNSHCQLFGGSGNDTLSLSLNNSQLGSGTAVIDGGGGRDGLTLQLLVPAGAYRLDFSAASVTLAGVFSITGIEAVDCTGGTGNDVLTASNGAAGQVVNKLDGQSGNDTLRASANGATLNGGFGIDLLIGAGGDDLLIGGFGGDNDILRGGGGNDILRGSIGRDSLKGGAGADTFSLAAFFESGTSATTRDVITDFRSAQSDKIDLAAIDANLLVLGDQTLDFIDMDAFENHAGELRYEQFDAPGTANDYTLLSGDLNGDGIAEFSIEIKGMITLNAGDLIL